MRVRKSAIGSVIDTAAPTSSTCGRRGSGPEKRSRAGRSGTARTCGSTRAGDRSACSGCSRASSTSTGAIALHVGKSWPSLLSLRRCRLIEGSGVLALVSWTRRCRVHVRVLFLQLLEGGLFGLGLCLALLVGDGRTGRGLLGAPRRPVDEREAEAVKQRVALLVGLGRGREDDVEPTDLVDCVVVDLREDDLLAHAERVVATPVELDRQAAEVADPRDRDRDQAVEELVHARPAQRDGHADRVALAQLELRNRLACATHVRVLPGDRRELLGGRLEDAGLALGVPDSHVHGDLLEARRLHRARVAEATNEPRLDLVVVLLLQARMDLGLCNWHQSMSFPERLATRTRRPSSSRRRPTRVGWFEPGSTSITFEAWIGPSASMIPPTWPPRWTSRSVRGFSWRFWTFAPSTQTFCFCGSVRSTLPTWPALLPAITFTLSPLRTRSFVAIRAPRGPARRSS